MLHHWFEDRDRHTIDSIFQVTIPHAYAAIECNMNKVLALRKQLKGLCPLVCWVVVNWASGRCAMALHAFWQIIVCSTAQRSKQNFGQTSSEDLGKPTCAHVTISTRSVLPDLSLLGNSTLICSFVLLFRRWHQSFGERFYHQGCSSGIKGEQKKFFSRKTELKNCTTPEAHLAVGRMYR